LRIAPVIDRNDRMHVAEDDSERQLVLGALMYRRAHEQLPDTRDERVSRLRKSDGARCTACERAQQ
jgi:hypothetical protein